MKRRQWHAEYQKHTHSLRQQKIRALEEKTVMSLRPSSKRECKMAMREKANVCV